MAKKRVFIGSASESKDEAAAIARVLADNGYQPLRWWQEFPPGSITLDRLLEIANVSDAAVFLFTSVDKTWYREEMSATPRDNVVLEYGVFVSHVGRKRTIVLKDNDARLPSDITAITYEKLISDITTVAERVVKHLDNQFSDPLPSPLNVVPVAADPTVVEAQVSPSPPVAWHNRDLYYGIEGAKAWLATVNEPGYSPEDLELRYRHLLFEASDLVEARSFVSFGPGDASTDAELAIRLRQREPSINYIPVDISDGLLHRAVLVLSNQVRVPVGILSDFEDRLNFIQRQVRTHATAPILFALLGNTLGDLDNYEGSFLSSLHSMMQSEDMFLLGVSILGPKWSKRTDPRWKHAGYGHAYRTFIANGVARRTGESVESVVTAFKSRFRFTEGSSDIAGTQCLDIVDTRSQRLVCTLRRYSWESLLSWLVSTIHFRVLYAKTALVDETVGDGVLLLQRQKAV